MIIRVLHPFGDNAVFSALFLMSLAALSIFSVDLIWHKVHLRASTGLSFERASPSWNRTFTKLLGLAATLGMVAFLYWVFPEYHGAMYNNYFSMLQIILPVWLLSSIPYFYYVDSKMVDPFDGYWAMGKLVLLQWRGLSMQILGQHVLGWLIKGFFLALMFTYMTDDLFKFVMNKSIGQFRFSSAYSLLYDFSFFIDVSLVSMSYLVSLRLTDTHLRSAEPTMLGWAVALVCYEPFWSVIGNHYLNYETPYKWGAWLEQYPVLYVVWGSSILLLVFIYVWATISFGARFSNLTHRGIITNGPYRWTKHPAYVAKNLSWWMIAIPFIAGGTPMICLRNCLMLLGLNGIYFLRAKTEEWHLSRDPTYRSYADWIAGHGLFRWVNPARMFKSLIR